MTTVARLVMIDSDAGPKEEVMKGEVLDKGKTIPDQMHRTLMVCIMHLPPRTGI